MIKKSIITICLLFVGILHANAATNNVSGIVKDGNNKFLPSVYVSVKNYSMLKTTTSLDGSFSILLPDSVKFPITLEFHSVGYKNKTLKITSPKKISKISVKLDKIANKDITRKKDKTADTTKLKLDVTVVSNIDAKKIEAEKRILKKGTKSKGGAVEFATMDVADRAVLMESAVVEDMAGMGAPIAPPPAGGNQAEAGKLTAGELNDFSKWELWQDITKEELAVYQQQWRINPNDRYVAQLMTPQGLPIINATVSLKDNRGSIIWETKTDNTGKAELWAKMLDDSVYNAGEPYTISFNYIDKNGSINAKPFAKGVNTIIIETNAPYPAMPRTLMYKVGEDNSTTPKYAVDIDFIVDATGSMGDEINYLQAELYDVIAKVENLNSHIRLRTASTFYRDYDDEYIIKAIPFDTNYNNTIEFIKLQSASGGGDMPEAVDDVLTESIENRDWTQNALTRIIFIILDAPPHQEKVNIEKMQRIIRIAAMKGIRIIPLICSGADKSTEYLMRSVALATNGTYVFLTDESGIGGEHLKPTTDKYEVEKLNSILLRVITEFCKLPQEDEIAKLDSTMDKFIPKPYKEAPVDSTERLQNTDIFRISPNPTNGILNIQIFKPIEDMYIADITGKVLQNLTNLQQNETRQIDINGYANGVFFVNVFYEGRWYTEKVILSR